MDYREGLSKLAWLRSRPQQSRTGVLVESELRLAEDLYYAVAFSHDEGGVGGAPSNDLMMRLRLPQLGPVAVSAFFARLDFRGLDDLFDPAKTLLALTVRYNVMDLFYVRARVVNEWWLRHEVDGDGVFETTTGFDLGVGVILDL